MATAKAAGAKAAPAPGDAPPSNKGKMLILILVALLIAVGAAGGAWFFVNQKAGPAAAPSAAAPDPAAPPVFMTLETFTVNLQPEDIQQFLQVNMTLQVTNDAQIELLKVHMPHVRNRMLLLLSSKKPSEILTVEGKKKLAAEVIAQLKQPFTPKGAEPQVTDVLFTSFVVQ